jgi:hypothetical protein
LASLALARVKGAEGAKWQGKMPDKIAAVQIKYLLASPPVPSNHILPGALSPRCSYSLKAPEMPNKNKASCPLGRASTGSLQFVVLMLSAATFSPLLGDELPVEDYVIYLDDCDLRPLFQSLGQARDDHFHYETLEAPAVFKLVRSKAKSEREFSFEASTATLMRNPRGRLSATLSKEAIHREDAADIIQEIASLLELDESVREELLSGLANVGRIPGQDFKKRLLYKNADIEVRVTSGSKLRNSVSLFLAIRKKSEVVFAPK